MTDPGKFREPIAIQAFVSAPDGAGGYTEAWSDVPAWSVLFAEIEPLRGNEQIRAMQTQAAGTHRVRMWGVEGLTSTVHRIRRHRDNGIMQIVAPPTFDPMRIEMELLVHETEVPVAA